MNEETLESPLQGTETVAEDAEQRTDTTIGERDTVEDDVRQSSENKSSETENTSDAAPEPSDGVNTEETHSAGPAEEKAAEEKEEAKVSGGEPPVDWFEPLEDDDDAESNDRNDPEEESLAGESERSESVAGSESTFKKIYQLQAPRRKRSHPDEGWVDWPGLGEGWKRKEVVRRSGSSIGQTDVYYLSPRGDRVRSRVELASVLEGQDLSNFEYKTGKFYDSENPLPRVRNRKRKVRERSSSESSWMERGEGADTPDSHHRLTPSLGPKNVNSSQTNVPLNSTVGTPTQGPRNEDPPSEDKIRLPAPSSSQSRPLPSINGEIGSEDSTLICARCGISFTGTWYDKQRKRPCCPTCWVASKTKEHPMIRFRKWIPCGQCVGCHNTVNCGQCANCKHGLQSPESRKRICRKRKCICPIRKGPGSGGFMQQRPYNDIPETFDDSMSFQSEVTDSQHPSLKSSDTENFSVNVDVDDEDDMSTDDDDDWHKKRKRRSCGECKACLCRKDCGTCDFCIDKPKFGGSNKKGRSVVYVSINWSSSPVRGSKHSFDMNVGNHQSSMQLNNSDFGARNGLSDRVPHISNHSSPHQDQQNKWDAERAQTGRDGPKQAAEDDEDELPMITQIFSLADNTVGTGADAETSS
ncbi:methyl-CpG-binding domain protein 1-like [Archocentrus centrarchus]|uniref:methyl-CpG-binding domain protein 1-like n=1 Tax=Archocentrus centrarchus TaxID=63155 RepID=UPI0011E9BF49|nr:methyl-CpG-binding domain protein 1-like [Archocentrus centrarchus]